jgi:hypothetical protein
VTDDEIGTSVDQGPTQAALVSGDRVIIATPMWKCHHKDAGVFLAQRSDLRCHIMHHQRVDPGRPFAGVEPELAVTGIRDL